MELSSLTKAGLFAESFFELTAAGGEIWPRRSFFSTYNTGSISGWCRVCGSVFLATRKVEISPDDGTGLEPGVSLLTDLPV